MGYSRDERWRHAQVTLADDLQRLAAQQVELAADIARLRARLDALERDVPACDAPARDRREAGAPGHFSEELVAGVDPERLRLAVSQAVEMSERLTLIRGIDAAAASLLNSLGINAFSDIAALTAEDVAEIERRLAARGQISRQGWIEQAAMLAQGTDTAHARALRAGVPARGVEAESSALWQSAPVAPASVAEACESIDPARAKPTRPERPRTQQSWGLVATAAVLMLTVGPIATSAVRAPDWPVWSNVVTLDPWQGACLSGFGMDGGPVGCVHRLVQNVGAATVGLVPR